MSSPAVETPIEEQPAPPPVTPEAAERAVEERPAKTLGEIIAGLPHLREVMARVEADIAAGRVPAEVDTDPDPVKVREEVIAERVARWRTGWETHMPRRYSGASLGSLKPGQDPNGKVTGWLASDHLGLALVGPAGRGKTYVLAALGYAALDQARVKPLLITMADLVAAMRPGGDATLFDKVTTADVLLLDDIGREQVTEWTLEQFQRLIDARNRHARRTAWSTNLSSEDLIARYGEPIFQRLMDDAVVANFKDVQEVMRPPAQW